MLTMCCYLLLCLNICWLICWVECVNDCVWNIQDCHVLFGGTCFSRKQHTTIHRGSTVISPPCGITSQTYQCPGSDIWSVDISRMLDPKYHPWFMRVSWFSWAFRIYEATPIAGWFIMENPTQKWMIWRYPQEISAVCCPTAMSQLLGRPAVSPSRVRAFSPRWRHSPGSKKGPNHGNSKSVFVFYIYIIICIYSI